MRTACIADIFIPTSNRIDALKPCLQSLKDQSQVNFHIILVGKSESPAVTKLVESLRFPSWEYLIQSSPGLIGAANEALDRSKHDIFVRIDDDVILSKHWFKNLANTYKNDRSIGGVTGPTTMSEKGLASRDLTKYLTHLTTGISLKGLLARIYISIIYENNMMAVSTFTGSGAFTVGSNFPDALKIKHNLLVDNLEACNWSARTKILKSVGGFDPLYLKGLGDYHEADAALKIKRLGYKLVFNPKAALQHNVEMGKVEEARPGAYWRIQNFILFYFRFNRFNISFRIVRFIVYLAIQNAYFIYKFVTTKNVNQLAALPGTIVGLIRAVHIKKYYEN